MTAEIIDLSDAFAGEQRDNRRPSQHRGLALALRNLSVGESVRSHYQSSSVRATASRAEGRFTVRKDEDGRFTVTRVS